jgi:hypothetical protein
MKTTHNLEFFSTDIWIGDFRKFQVGTVGGAWRATPISYEILALDNSQPGNGHMIDVIEWFEASCKRDKRSLRILECWNLGFKKHLIEKHGFTDIGNNQIEKTWI